MTHSPSEAAEQPWTGDVQVDAALTRLGELEDRDLDAHAEVYDDIHRALGSVLDGTSEGGPDGGADRRPGTEGS